MDRANIENATRHPRSEKNIPFVALFVLRLLLSWSGDGPIPQRAWPNVLLHHVVSEVFQRSVAELRQGLR